MLRASLSETNYLKYESFCWWNDVLCGQRRAKEVVDWREWLKRADHQMEAQLVVQERANEHREDYQRRRQVRLGKGYRRSSLYRKDRVKEIIKIEGGPKLEIVIKGKA